MFGGIFSSSLTRLFCSVLLLYFGCSLCSIWFFYSRALVLSSYLFIPIFFSISITDLLLCELHHYVSSWTKCLTSSSLNMLMFFPFSITTHRIVGHSAISRSIMYHWLIGRRMLWLISMMLLTTINSKLTFRIRRSVFYLMVINCVSICKLQYI